MKASSITTLAALVLIGIGGFVAGRISSSGNATVQSDSPSDAQSSRGAASAATATATESGRKLQRPERGGTSSRAAAGSSAERLAKLESIIRGANPLDRNRSLLALIDQLAPGDFEAAVANFRSLGMTESRFGEYGMLLAAWAKADPLAALAYAKANTTSGFATSTILTTWASADPEAAIRWAEANHEGDGANPYLPGIIRAIATTDPVRATQLLTSMPRSVERGEALDAMMPSILSQGSEAARAWIAAIQDESLRSGATSRAAEELAAADPAGTAAWLLANPGEATRRSVDDVYSVWAGQDRGAALASFATLPVGENRSNALRGLVNNIAPSDPKAAVSMMDSYAGDVTDRVVQQFVWHSFGTDPLVAVNQISRITDQEDRDQMYRRTIDAWIEEDAAAATAWISTNPLPPAVLEQINRNQAKQNRQ